MGDMTMHVAPLTWGVALTTWNVDPGWDLAILVAVAGYLAAFVVGRRRGGAGRPSRARACSFVAGLLVLLLSVDSAVETYSHVLFWMHMVQHLLLIMVVPALVVVGHPVSVVLQALPPASRTRAETVAGSRAVSVLTHPAVGLGLYAVVIVSTHLTGFVQAMFTHPWLHLAEQLLYLAAGVLFLMPLLADEPIRWRPSYLLRLALLLIGMTPDTVVGIVLLQTEHELFPAFAAQHRTWGPSPVGDLHAGGAIMWVVGDGLMMCFAVAVAIAYIAHRDTNDTAGTWLEDIRRSTMAGNVRSTRGDAGPIESSSNLDDDEASLAAYNAMLRRLNGEAEGARVAHLPTRRDRSQPPSQG